MFPRIVKHLAWQPSHAFRHGIDRQLARVRYIFRAEELAFVSLGGAIGVMAGVAVTDTARKHARAMLEARR